MACLLKKGKNEKLMRVLSPTFVTRNSERIPRSVLGGSRVNYRSIKIPNGESASGGLQFAAG